MTGDRGKTFWLQSFARYAAQHPFLTIEHCLVIIFILRACTDPNRAHPNSVKPCKAGRASCCYNAPEAGALSALIAQGVSPAPAATMEVPRVGHVAAHNDFRGDIYRFPLSSDVILNLMKTKPGTMRSGDLHNCTQYDISLKGKVRLHTLDLATQREAVNEYSANELIVIPPRVAHLFEFPEENYMIEWWDCGFKAWYYEPYRKRIAAQFKIQQAEWQRQQSTRGDVNVSKHSEEVDEALERGGRLVDPSMNAGDGEMGAGTRKLDR